MLACLDYFVHAAGIKVGGWVCVCAPLALLDVSP